MRHGRGNGDNNSIVFGSKYPAAVLGLNKACVCLEQWSSPALLNMTLPAKLVNSPRSRGSNDLGNLGRETTITTSMIRGNIGSSKLS